MTRAQYIALAIVILGVAAVVTGVALVFGAGWAAIVGGVLSIAYGLLVVPT